ncbi:MAG: hypothetical protein KGS10_04515 [Chloroflexi bacterium]|nr:hypothetical protein [Chloroflexota bacterium]
MNPSEIASELVVILWPQAGYPKIPPAVRRRAQSVIARVAWDRAIEKAKAELPRSTYDWHSKVARNAWNATIPQDERVYSLSVLTHPYPFDATTAYLQRMAMKAIERRVKEITQSHTSDEAVYERWMEWAKLSDSHYFKAQTAADLLTRRR